MSDPDALSAICPGDSCEVDWAGVRVQGEVVRVVPAGKAVILRLRVNDRYLDTAAGPGWGLPALTEREARQLAALVLNGDRVNWPIEMLLKSLAMALLLADHGVPGQ